MIKYYSPMREPVSSKNAWDEIYKKSQRRAQSRPISIFAQNYEEEYLQVGERFLTMLDVKKNEKILDAGCGSLGKIIIPAAKRNLNVTGIDISKTAIELLQNKICKLKLEKNCKLYVGDINSLPFEDGGFDKVFSTGTLLHLPFLDEYIAELTRVTKKGGFLLLSYFKNKSSLINIFDRMMFKIEMVANANSPGIYFHNFQDIKEIFGRNNLKIMKTLSYHGFVPFYMLFRFPANFSRKYVFREIEHFDPSAHTWSFILRKS